MDRFIEIQEDSTNAVQNSLKSNMDRFIALQKALQTSSIAV